MFLYHFSNFTSENNEIPYDGKLRAKLKWALFKKKVSEGSAKAGKWISDNPTEATALFLAVGSGAVKLVKSNNNRKAARDLRYHDERTFYDNRNQVRFETKRKLSNRERMEVAMRMDHGESCYDILKDMRAI